MCDKKHQYFTNFFLSQQVPARHQPHPSAYRIRDQTPGLQGVQIKSIKNHQAKPNQIQSNEMKSSASPLTVKL